MADTCVLLNFLQIDRMDLIGAHPDAFMATDHVAAEITDLAQLERYEEARRAGFVAEEHVTHPAELEIFLRLEGSGRLGAGERSAIAVALNRGYRLATDDNKAIKRAAREAAVASRELRFVRTEDIVTELIQHGALTIAAADEMLTDWAANHRRVAQRVSEGGHDIPEPVARRRFERSWDNFVSLYRPIADEWQVYDTSSRSPILVAASERNDILPLLPSGWRIRELPTAVDADRRDLSDDPTRRSAMTEDKKQAPDRFPEGEPSIQNVMIALRQARDDALARAAAVRRGEAEAARAENATSTAEN